MVGLGVALRLARYSQNAPLWWNEAFVAVNFFDRSYLDLLKPLDYGQVCPLGFLWVEKTLVDLSGFSEWSLRLYPLIAGISALALFARVAEKTLPPPSALLSVGFLAMAYHPVRLCSEAKPYASDLLAAVVVLWLATDGSRNGPRPGQRFLRLAWLAPLLIVMSHPAVFVLAGVFVGSAIADHRLSRRRSAMADPTEMAAWLVLGASVVLSFGACYVLYTRGQSLSALDGMRDYWRGSFPPLDAPLSVVPWLLKVHTGRMMAYPVGGAHAGSIITFIFVIYGTSVLARHGRRGFLGVLLLPFGLTLLASALQRHPYGGHPRIAQHLAPAICLLAGTGLEALMARFRNPARKRRLIITSSAVLALLGLVPVAAEWSHPFRSDVEQRARELARRTWSDSPVLVSLRGRIPGAPAISADPDVPLMLCNLKIVNPGADVAFSNPRNRITRPTRYVLSYSPRLEAPEIEAWTKRLRSQAGSVHQTERIVNLGRGPRKVVTIDVQPRTDRLARSQNSSHGCHWLCQCSEPEGFQHWQSQWHPDQDPECGTSGTDSQNSSP